MHYQIKNWAGNVLCFDNRFKLPELSVVKKFDNFDEAWNWLVNRFGPDEVDLVEYWIEEVKG